MSKINLLDCTLRDGGYINDWRFGKDAISDMIEKLADTNVEVLEVGFLKDEPYQPDRTVFRSMDQVKKLINPKKAGLEYAVMCEVVNPLPLELLAPRDEESADIIRVIVWKTKHDKDGNVVDALDEGFDYCKGIVERGYKLCVQPARVDQYSDEEFVAMVRRFATLNPMALYVVDSWGTQNPEQLLHYMHLADQNMDGKIILGYHGHNNMMQALSAAQAMIKEGFQRDIMIDASVYGIGRGAGNLNLEIIANYLNQFYGKEYYISPIMQVYSNYIQAIFEKEQWGFSVPYFLTAKYNCNPSYAKCLVDLGASDCIEKILKKLDEQDRVIFSKAKAEQALYSVKKKLAIVVPTSNRPEIIKYWIRAIGRETYHLGWDLIFYDSSSNEIKREIKQYISLSGLPNVRFLDYSGQVDKVLCHKVYSAAAAVVDEYQYIWFVRDRSIPNVLEVYRNITTEAAEGSDFFIVYPHYIDPHYYGTKIYTDCAELFKNLCGELTSLGSLIFSQKTLEDLVHNHPVDDSNLGLWLPIALFQYLPQKKFKAYFFSDNSFTYLPYTGSFWIKSATLLWLFTERWNKMIDALPAVYDDVREDVRKFEGWQIPPFNKNLLLSARISKDVTLKRVIHYRKDLNRCAPQMIFKLFCVSMIPSGIIKFYLSGNDTLMGKSMKIAGRFAKKIIKLFLAVEHTIVAPFKKKIEMPVNIHPDTVENAVVRDQMYSSVLLSEGENTTVHPILSLVIPTYNRPIYLKDALNSVAALYPVEYEWECIVVDNEPYNGTKNETQRLVEQMNLPNLRYYRNSANLGADGNINRGVMLARGKWVSLLHDDDLLYPDFLVRMFTIIQGLEKENVGLIFGVQNFVYYRDFTSDAEGKKQFYWNSYNNMVRQDRYRLIKITDKSYISGDNAFNVPTCGCTYLKEAFLRFGGHNEKRFGLVDDAFLAYKVFSNYAAYECLTPFGDYRYGSGITSSRLREIIIKHYELRDYLCSKHLFGRIFKKSLQMEYTKNGEKAFASFDPKVAKEVSNQLVHYVPNPLRRIIVAMIRKLYYKRLYKKAVDILADGSHNRKEKG